MTDVHNQLKQAPELSLAIRRMFGGDSGLSVERLSETLQPIVNVWEHPECCYLRGERLWSARTVQSGVAGELAYVAIANPAGSDMLVLIERAWFRSAAAGGVFVGMQDDASITGILSSANVTGRDRRIGPTLGTAVGRTQIRRGTNVASIAGSALAFLSVSAANISEPIDIFPVILEPGNALVIEHGSSNTLLDVTAVGYERKAVPGEFV